MAAVVRMKRKRNEDQIEEIVIHLKSGNDEVVGETQSGEMIAKKFKFAATVDSKKTPISDPVSKAIRESKLNKLRNVINNKQNDSAKRTNKLIDFKIVDKKKAKDFDSLGVADLSDTESRYLFFDVEKNIKKNDVQDVEMEDCEKEENEKENDDEYVYDLYYMNEYTFDYSCFNHIQNIQAIEQPDNLWVGNDDELDEYDENDENQEDYYTNQYPDHDDVLVVKDDDSSDDDDPSDDEDDEEKDYDGEYDDDDDFIVRFGDQVKI